MSFDLSHYQPQFLEKSASDSDSSLDKKKQYKHLYQTIFLDRDSAEHLWTKNEIKKEEIVREEWWKQQSHRVNHYRGTVPFVRCFIPSQERRLTPRFTDASHQRSKSHAIRWSLDSTEYAVFTS